MRVVDVTQWYAETSGGIRTYLHAKAQWAKEVHLEHAIVVPGPASDEATVAASPLVRLRGRTPSKRWGYRMVVRPGPIVRALDELQPDVVVMHDVMSFPSAVGNWAAARGIQTAMFCHSNAAAAVAHLPRALSGPLGGVLCGIERRAFHVPRVIFAVRRVAEGIPRGLAPIVRVQLGVDAAHFGAAVSDAALRNSLVRPDQTLLLYAGRLSMEKRVDLLPQMLAALPGRDAVLVLAGEGAADQHLDRLAQRLGVADRVRRLGHVSDRADLATLMATADCFVHPNEDEPFGLAPVEALASGCRVVLPAAAGCAELLASRGAVTVVESDANGLARGVAAALALPRPEPNLDDLSWDRTFRSEWAHYRALVSLTQEYAA